MIVTSSVLADRPAAPAAELWRVRLPWACRAGRGARGARGRAVPLLLVGAWAGGGTIVASEPLRVAEPHDEPFALLDDAARGRRACGAAGRGRWRLVRLARVSPRRTGRAGAAGGRAAGAAARLPPRLLRPRAALRIATALVVRGACDAGALVRSGRTAGACETPPGRRTLRRDDRPPRSRKRTRVGGEPHAAAADERGRRAPSAGRRRVP